MLPKALTQKTDPILRDEKVPLRVAKSKEDWLDDFSTQDIYDCLLRKLDLSTSSSLLNHISMADVKKIVSDNNRIGKKEETLHNTQHICLPGVTGYELIETAEIIRCEADNSYCKIYLSSCKVHIVSRTLKSILSCLDSDSFLRIHQSHAINSSYISRIEKHDGMRVILKDSSEVPVSRSYKKSLMGMLNVV